MQQIDEHAGLTRFLEAQNPIYQTVLAELQAGRKRTHWMWFVFPQIAGLGSSPTARVYAMADLAEARAYLAHPILGPRLQECTRLVLAANGTPDEIFGYPDNLKLHSSLTLFALASEPGSLFHQALQNLFAGRQDAATLKRISPNRT